jgi:hypothetical protein
MLYAQLARDSGWNVVVIFLLELSLFLNKLLLDDSDLGNSKQYFLAICAVLSLTNALVVSSFGKWCVNVCDFNQKLRKKKERYKRVQNKDCYMYWNIKKHK